MLARVRPEDTPLLLIDVKLCVPADLIMTHVPAPPVCIRPSVAVSATIKNEDDLTVKLSEIVYYNQEI